MTKRDTSPGAPPAKRSLPGAQKEAASRALPPDALEDLFEAARSSGATEPAVEPSPDLLARVMADALAAQAHVDQTGRPARRPRAVWQGVGDTLGGWLGMGGLALAGVTGLAIGLGAPDMLGSGVTEGLAGLAPDAGSELVFDPLETFDVGLLLEESGT